MHKLTIVNTGETVEISQDTPILRRLTDLRIPIRHNCRGRARCTTCRCRIIEGAENLTPKNEFEDFVLNLQGVNEPDIRLACQTRLTGDAEIEYVNEMPEEDRPWTIDPAYELPRWSPEEMGHPKMKEEQGYDL